MQTLTHYQVTAELVHDDKGPMIELTQQDGSLHEPSSVYLHPWQLKTVLENFGMVAADKGAEKMIATLERRLLVLRNRIDDLHSYMVDHSDHKHADLSFEMTCLSATLDIADEFCHGLDTPAQGAALPLNVVHPTPAPNAMTERSPAHGDAAASKQQFIDFKD